MNQNYGATVLMVTHDSFAASYTGRVLFIRDGKIFTELRRGDSPRPRVLRPHYGSRRHDGWGGIRCSLSSHGATCAERAKITWLYRSRSRFAVTVFYAFNTISVQAALVLEEKKGLPELLSSIMSGLTIFLAVVMELLTVYANNFIMKRRKKEFRPVPGAGHEPWPSVARHGA